MSPVARARAVPAFAAGQMAMRVPRRTDRASRLHTTCSGMRSVQVGSPRASGPGIGCPKSDTGGRPALAGPGRRRPWRPVGQLGATAAAGSPSGAASRLPSRSGPPRRYGSRPARLGSTAPGPRPISSRSTWPHPARISKLRALAGTVSPPATACTRSVARPVTPHRVPPRRRWPFTTSRSPIQKSNGRRDGRGDRCGGPRARGDEPLDPPRSHEEGPQLLEGVVEHDHDHLDVGDCDASRRRGLRLDRLAGDDVCDEAVGDVIEGGHVG